MILFEEVFVEGKGLLPPDSTAQQGRTPHHDSSELYPTSLMSFTVMAGALEPLAGGGPAQKEYEFTQGLGLKFQAVIAEGRLRSSFGMRSIVAFGMNPQFLLETWRSENLG